MIANDNRTWDREQYLDAVIAEYLKALRAGEAPEEQQWLASYPDLAAELAEFLANREQLERLAKPLRTSVACSPAAETSHRSIADYELLEEIGRGGMGVVYKARQIRLNRIAALKMIRAGQLASLSDVQRFQTEAKAAASLDHPHIVPIYEVGEDRGQHYFSMKLIEGQNLAESLHVDPNREGEALDEPRTPFRSTSNSETRRLLKILATVADAVHYAHQHGILHRDLKPGNILLDSADHPYVTDFGLAKLVAGENTATQSGAIVGTASYMAPEQAAGSKGLTTAADIYSLGAILYEVLTGRPPFREETALETLLRVRERDPARPSDVRPKVDRDLETICIKCLERDPLRRYGSAEALADELQRWLAGEPIHARPVSRVERTWRHCRRNPVVSSLLAAVVFVAAGGFVGVISQWQVAVANGQEAIANAAAAQVSAQEAKNQAQVAAVQRDEAQKQRDEVKALADKLLTTQQDLKRTLYAAHMNLAHNEWDKGSVVRVHELLDQNRPKPGETDLRGFEWHYLDRLGHQQILTLQGHTDTIRSVAYSADGKRLASASRDKTVKVWDAQTGQELLTFKGHTTGVRSVVFSPDGKRLASVTNELKVWNSQTGEELLVIKECYDMVAFSPDGKRVASYSGNNLLKVWDAQTGLEVLVFKGHSFDVHSVAFSPDGNRLATASYDHTVKIWDAQTGHELITIEGDYFGVAFSPDSKHLASASYDNTVKVWDALTGQELHSFKHSETSNLATSAAFSPDGKHLACSSEWGTLRIWDLKSGQEIRTLKGVGGTAVYSPVGQRLASSSVDNTVKVWDVQKDQESRTLKGDGGKSALNHDWRRLASAASDNSVKIRDAESGKEIVTLKGHSFRTRIVAFSPDGNRVATGAGGPIENGVSSKDHAEVMIWDATTGKELFTLQASNGAVFSLAFSPDGNRLASASGAPGFGRPFNVKVWDVQTGQQLQSLEGLTGLVWDVAFSPDGKRLVTGGGAVKVWDVQTGQQLLTLERLGGNMSVAFSPDGSRLASGGVSSGEVKVWDALTGQELLSLKGHHGRIPSVAFSPDGKRLVSASNDKTVRIWDAQTGQELLSLEVSDYRNGLSFSPDGHRLAGIGDGGITIFDATPLPEKP